MTIHTFVVWLELRLTDDGTILMLYHVKCMTAMDPHQHLAPLNSRSRILH